MKFWDNIRKSFYKKKLAEQLSKLEVTHAIINLDDAKSIGVVYDSTDTVNDGIISGFADKLRKQGKTVEVLGFINDKKINEKPGIVSFNKKNLNWAQVPQGETVEKFAAKNFDLLIACYTGENLPLEFIARISNARWRLGFYDANKTDCYDMMINMGEHHDLQYLLDQSVYFLKEIKVA